MLDFTKLRRNTKKDFSGLKRIKVAVLSDSASQLLCTALKGYGYEQDFHYDVFEAGYNEIESEVFNPKSEFYAFEPDVVIVAKSTQKLLPAFYATGHSERKSFANEKISELNDLCETIEKRLAAKVILFTFIEKDDRVFGNYANKTADSFLYQIRKLNLGLMDLAQHLPSVFVCDVQQLALETGWHEAVDAKNYISSDLVWNLNFLPLVVKHISGIVEAFEGRFKKCIVVDLDNTLWGGVIGDDGTAGIEIGSLGCGKAFSDLQQWIKELRNRGIIVCVCSKNDETVAKEPFQTHPDMILRLDDIAVFAANWDNKVDNLHLIQETLSIGFDSTVFVDDNPFERGMVKEAIPALEVPELPEDPANYLSFLQSLNLFETASYTTEDRKRVQQYQEESKRISAKKVYQNEDEYLTGLQMKAEILPLDEFTIPRAAQLSQRSNQFNLRTVRYTENDLQKIAASDDYKAFVLRLSDKFGDYGIISFVVLKKQSSSVLFIENWMMSCRVLKRGVETLVLNHIVQTARQRNFEFIAGEYLPTHKNGLVKNHFQNLGFKSNDGNWQLDTAAYQNRPVLITTSTIAEVANNF